MTQKDTVNSVCLHWYVLMAILLLIPAHCNLTGKDDVHTY